MVLTDDNFLVYAIKHYTAPSCPTMDEFESDLRTIIYIKKHLNRDPIQHRQLLNHIITLFNCFGDGALFMLLHRIDAKYWNILITFLIYINRMPEQIPEYGIDIAYVELDKNLINELRNL